MLLFLRHAVDLLNSQDIVTTDFHKDKVCVFDREEALQSNKDVMKTFNIPSVSRLESSCD